MAHSPVFFHGLSETTFFCFTWTSKHIHSWYRWAMWQVRNIFVFQIACNLTVINISLYFLVNLITLDRQASRVVMGKPDLSVDCEKMSWRYWSQLRQQCVWLQLCQCKSVLCSWMHTDQDKEGLVSLHVTLVLLGLAYYSYLWIPHFKSQGLEYKQRITQEDKCLEAKIISAIEIANLFHRG